MSRPLIIFEMANNHGGSVEIGKRIIYDFAAVAGTFHNFRFAFKFQLRNLRNFIHPKYKNRMDIKYVKRFTESTLSKDEICKLKKCVVNNNLLTICTAFDEESVKIIEDLHFDYIKIASCSLTDWRLLNRIADTNLPIIASIAGNSLENVDKVVSFFSHREKSLSLMHCIGEYPSLPEYQELNQIDVLKQRYPNMPIGWSTHESPDDITSIKIAVSKGAQIFEKHVGIEIDGKMPNNYSVNPNQMLKWMSSAMDTYGRCGTDVERIPSFKEIIDLKQFKRGTFASCDIKSGEIIDRQNTYSAWPNIENQVLANDMSKYIHFVAHSDIKKDDPILITKTTKVDTREKVWDAVQKVKTFLIDSNVKFPGKAKLELSHHYGMDNFSETGITMITVINREYCKKLIIVLPGQHHPEQYHKQKEETFVILHGKLNLNIDGHNQILNENDICTVKPLSKHSFHSETGCIIEELSSTHNVDDSFYSDDTITSNKQRKTIINYWL